MKIVNGFVWFIVTDKAKEVFEFFELYALYPDGSESLCYTIDSLNRALEAGLQIGIEVGHIQ